MGKTNPTYRDEIERFETEYADFRRILRRKRQEHFDAVFRQMRDVGHGGQAMGPVDAREAMLLSVLITQEERIATLEDELGIDYRYSRERGSGEDLDSFISQD